MRPNFAQDAPPTSIEVGGHSYECATDFRAWLDIIEHMRHINLHPETLEKQMETVRAIEDLETMVFGGVLADESLEDIFEGINRFAKGYPTAPIKPDNDDDGVRIFSFQYDLNEIIMAIYDQHRVDLSYRCAHCHWWEFLLYFHTLSGDHYILNLMQARGYKGNDKDMIKRKNACALPVELDAEEQAALEAFEAMFDPK